MPTVLGVTCKKDLVLFAVAREGELADGPQRLQTSALLEETERLQSMIEDVARVIAEVDPEIVRILLPEQTYEDSYTRIAPRAALETIVRLAAVNGDRRVEMLNRASARARLGMPKSGRFDSHIDGVVRGERGSYWNAGRNLAAAAALADD